MLNRMTEKILCLGALGVILAVPACTTIHSPFPQAGRIIHADVAALDHPLYYNRFGSVNPYGMIYALDRDVVKVRTGEEWLPGLRCLSEVRLRDGKRPRPLVLRGNVGDILEIAFTNRLLDKQPDMKRECTEVDGGSPYGHLVKKEDTLPSIDPPEHEERIDQGVTQGKDTGFNDWPKTRTANLMIVGLTSLSRNDPRCNGLESLAPGESVTCRWRLERSGTHLFSSHGAPAGGEGDGGSLTHGLFGAVIVEPKGSRWYRSQVTSEILDKAWKLQPNIQHARLGELDYEAVDETGIPYLNMLQHQGGNRYELVHGDLHAVVVESVLKNPEAPPSFREFTAIFHDELKTFYADDFQELEESRQLSGVRDGFAVNYGSSGMGSILLANRKGIGPATECKECLYEEFFLQSWANGDPALLENFQDDPSNVFHSYLNDRVQFRNLHAGPKETHVFHLHAHQWLSSADTNSGTYLDSQTIAPQQGFSYEIYDGGLLRWGNGGWYLSNGSGNRNRAPGDSIFHCHLYPHFAQGMWALWRVHDVIEDGTRKLPDGQANMHLFTNARIALSGGFVDSTGGPRLGTEPLTGLTDTNRHGGTPIPAVLPLPGQALPPLPLYAQEDGMPGYPFYIPGKPGHRAPQPPLDFAKNSDGHVLHGGLPRHVFGNGERRPSFMTKEEFDKLDPKAKTPNELLRYALATGDFREELVKADIQVLPSDGTPLEKAAMQFHAGQAPAIRLADGSVVTKDPERPGYPSKDPKDGDPGRLFVNGTAPKPGAPFADPCGAPAFAGKPGFDPFTGEGGFVQDPAMNGHRRYEVSAVELDLIVNRAGWHDPQARINVLTKEADDIEHTVRNDQEPFFFRAASGECIEFRHQNRIHKELQLDDFQVATPTDIIGQHIHLVKFDVTSSDGSANGFNYEDGTLAADAVEERIHAANAFGGAEVNGVRRNLALGKDLEGHDVGIYQTTIQRWFADPLLTVRAEGIKHMSMSNMPDIELPSFPCADNPESECRDRTLRTVFTHDHFAPSSIQQHGFYSALLVEPAGTKWLKPDGTPLADAQGQAVGSKAMIVEADDWLTHENHREFALAVADFALLYDPRVEEEGSLTEQGMGRLLIEAKAENGVVQEISDEAVQRLDTYVNEWWRRHGRPVDPPFKPEAISKDHHNPYLVNYKHEALPLRIGKMEGDLQVPEETGCGQSALKRDENGYIPETEKRKSVKRQRSGKEGDLAFVFATREHGDPCTPILEAYEGEKIQIRMVQGAQEVQHMFAIEGLSWPRVIDYEVDKKISDEQLAKQDNAKLLVSSQEIGISEHFEMDLPPFQNVRRGAPAHDYLYHFGTVDALWNGAWGLIRIYNGKEAWDPQSCQKREPRVDFQTLEKISEAADIWWYKRNLFKLPSDDRNIEDFCEHIGERLNLLTEHGTGKIRIANKKDIFNDEAQERCPSGSHLVTYHVAATRLNLLTLNGVQPYDAGQGLFDPDGLILLAMPPGDNNVTLESVKARYGNQAKAGELEPLVLRVNAGDCLKLTVHNLLLSEEERTNQKALPDQSGDALMPKIVPLNVDRRGESESDVDDVQSSTRLALSIPMLYGETATDHNIGIGINRDVDPSLTRQKMFLYAGLMDLEPANEKPHGAPDCPDEGDCDYNLTPKPYAFGVVPIKAFGDVIGHGVHGLLGTLIVEPQGAKYVDPVSRMEKAGWELGTRAVIQYIDENKLEKEFQEFVVMYQDGLNLHWNAPWDENGNPLPTGQTHEVSIDNCPICDDSYDRGEKGINYRSAPFWARLRQGKVVDEDGALVTQDTGPGSNLNHVIYPNNFFQESWSSIPTPTFQAKAGEEVRFRVVQPHGRARQRAFLTGGHDYHDFIPQFGSPHSAIMSAGKAINATLEGGAKEGCYIYRDGPAQIFAGGAWGRLNVSPSDGTALVCQRPAQD
ncbi:MAG: hypothetical protein KC594_02885 [Nitrospira sp.]|nr:hypothetical protein [Nitrospira sp.]